MSKPHWIWGRAGNNSGDCPVCSKCQMAMPPSEMRNHRKECWKEFENDNDRTSNGRTETA